MSRLSVTSSFHLHPSPSLFAHKKQSPKNPQTNTWEEKQDRVTLRWTEQNIRAGTRVSWVWNPQAAHANVTERRQLYQDRQYCNYDSIDRWGAALPPLSLAFRSGRNTGWSITSSFTLSNKIFEVLKDKGDVMVHFPRLLTTFGCYAPFFRQNLETRVWNPGNRWEQASNYTATHTHSLFSKKRDPNDMQSVYYGMFWSRCVRL